MGYAANIFHLAMIRCMGENEVYCIGEVAGIVVSIF